MSSRIIIGAVLFPFLARAFPLVGQAAPDERVEPEHVEPEYLNCSRLSGLEKAECMNKNFDNGLYLGSADSCANDGEIACTPDHQFAICNYGKWVVTECAAGTSCYAFNFHGVEEVTVRCHFTEDMDEYEDDENENENAEVQPLKKMKRSPIVVPIEPEHVEPEYLNCSRLSGLEKAECMNNNFDNGLYLGSADSCNDGEIACTPDHEFAVCDYGKWVVTECAAGTSCYAFNFHGVDEVTVRCHFTEDMDEYEDDDENEHGGAPRK